MVNQLTTNADALRLFFTEDVYLVKKKSEVALDRTHQEKTNLLADETHKNSNIDEKKVSEFLSVEEQAQTGLKKNWNFEYLGKNQKGILILVNDNLNKVSSTQGNLLLRKLVDAIELANTDFALVNYANYQEAKFEDLNTFFNCELLLAFGVEAQMLGLDHHVPHQLHYLGNTKLIFTTNLHDLDSDQESKKILWTTLKQLK